MAAACRRLAAQPVQALALIGIALENYDPGLVEKRLDMHPWAVL